MMQRYISDELTHFVGRGLPEAEQYRLLCNILKSGWLTHPPHNPGISGNLSVNPAARLSENQMFTPQVVCFCDIPVADFPIHVSKYSPFSVAFTKEFLITKGASPVFYIPISAPVRMSAPTPRPQHFETDKDWKRWVDSQWKEIPKGKYFDEMTKKLNQVLQVRRFTKPPKTMEDLDQFFSDMRQQMEESRDVTEVDRMLSFHVFSYIKFFDPSLPDDHPDNYYFEREWRVLGNVQFSLATVSRVCMPREYATRFRGDVPEYCGQLTFLADNMST